MSRIPYPDLADLSDEKRAYADLLGPRMLNVVRMSLHTPHGLWEAQRDLAAGSVMKATIDPRLREVLILRVAHLSKSEYELHHHLSIARNLGMSEATLRALETGDYAALTGEERAIAQFTTEVVEDITPADATLAAIRALFSDSLIFEMVALIGNYMLTARVVAVSGCELDGAALAGFERDKARLGATLVSQRKGKLRDTRGGTERP